MWVTLFDGCWNKCSDVLTHTHTLMHTHTSHAHTTNSMQLIARIMLFAEIKNENVFKRRNILCALASNYNSNVIKLIKFKYTYNSKTVNYRMNCLKIKRVYNFEDYLGKQTNSRKTKTEKKSTWQNP